MNNKHTQESILSGRVASIPEVKRVVDAVKERITLEQRLNELDLFIYSMVSDETTEVVTKVKKKPNNGKLSTPIMPSDEEEAAALRQERLPSAGVMGRRLAPELSLRMRTWVGKHYKQLTARQMAYMLGIADITVRQWLKKAGLKAKVATVRHA